MLEWKLLGEEVGPADLVMVNIPTGTTYREDAKLLVNAVWPCLAGVNTQLEPDTSNLHLACSNAVC